MNQKARDILATIVGPTLGVAVFVGYSVYGGEHLPVLSNFQTLGRGFSALGPIPDWREVLIALDLITLLVFVFPSIHLCAFEIIAGRPHRNSIWLSYPLAMVGFLILVAILTLAGIANPSQAMLMVLGLAILVAFTRRMWPGRT